MLLQYPSGSGCALRNLPLRATHSHGHGRPWVLEGIACSLPPFDLIALIRQSVPCLRCGHASPKQLLSALSLSSLPSPRCHPHHLVFGTLSITASLPSPPPRRHRHLHFLPYLYAISPRKSENRVRLTFRTAFRELRRGFVFKRDAIFVFLPE